MHRASVNAALAQLTEEVEAFLVVLYEFVDLLKIRGLFNPTKILPRCYFKNRFCAVFRFEAILKHFKLKRADRSVKSLLSCKLQHLK